MNHIISCILFLLVHLNTYGGVLPFLSTFYPFFVQKKCIITVPEEITRVKFNISSISSSLKFCNYYAKRENIFLLVSGSFSFSSFFSSLSYSVPLLVFLFVLLLSLFMYQVTFLVEKFQTFLFYKEILT